MFSRMGYIHSIKERKMKYLSWLRIVLLMSSISVDVAGGNTSVGTHSTTPIQSESTDLPEVRLQPSDTQEGKPAAQPNTTSEIQMESAVISMQTAPNTRHGSTVEPTQFLEIKDTISREMPSVKSRGTMLDDEESVSFGEPFMWTQNTQSDTSILPQPQTMHTSSKPDGTTSTPIMPPLSFNLKGK